MLEEFPTKKWRRLLCSASFFILLVLFAANVIRAHTLGMDRNPGKWVFFAIPPALSDLVFGNRGGYTSLKAVNDVFYAAVQEDPITGDKIDRAIRAVMALNPVAVSSQTVLAIGDDKGIIDLVKISFRLFGYNKASPFYLYFVLLFLSALIFALTFNAPFFHTVLASFLVAHYLLLPTVFYHTQLQSVLALRFLPVLSMIACLHCMLFATRPTFSVLGLTALALQVGLLIFVIHMRSVTMWQVIVVGVFTLLVLGRRAYQSHFRLTRRTLQCFIPAIIPILFVMSGLAGLSAYRNVAYDQRYHRGEELLTRVFWHSIFLGLAFNPALAERYQLKVDDYSAVRAVSQITIETGHASEWNAIGGSSTGFRWAAYDLLARDALLELCLHREPGQCVANVIYYKPLSLMRHLAWLYGFRDDIPDRAIFVSAGWAGNAMGADLDALKASLDRTGLQFRLWHPIAIFMVVSFAIILFATNDTPRMADVIPGIVLTAGTAIPTLVGFPSLHTIAEPTIAIAASLYSGIAVLFGCGIDWRQAGKLVDRRTL
jgi:hypothetical protein